MQVKDPVCGMMVDDQTAPARSTYQGNTYYFCGEDCKKQFDANPSRYTAEAGAGVISN